MDNIFVQLAFILGLSCVLGYVAKTFKLPLLIAYLFGGLIIASTTAFDVHSFGVLHFLPEIGVAFMLFLVGMELDLREIKSLGKPIIAGATLQIFITTITGAIIARLLGFGGAESWYLGAGLAISSTVVVVKILLDKKELSSLYGRLSLGILLVDDLFAVIILLFLTASPSALGLGFQQAFPIMILVLKTVVLFGAAIIINKYVLPYIFKIVSDSGELLFLTALAWCFIYVSVAIFLGFSVLIGAFLAGINLASSVYHYQIQSKVKPLRDFFVALFFVYLGTQVNFNELVSGLPLIVVFTLYAIAIKPVIFLLVLGIFGFRKHTMFQTALNLSQISEFSLILLLVGLQKNLVSSGALTIIALTGVLSMVISSVMITHGKKLYKVLGKGVNFFERKNFRHFMEAEKSETMKGHVVVVGGHRVGGELVQLFKKEKIPQIVLDFNPQIIQALLKMHIPIVYGDMGDPEVLDALDLQDARMVISTAPGIDDNKLLLEEIKTRKINIPVIVRGETAQEATELYQAGADYVIIPEVLAGDFLVEKLKKSLSGKYFEDRADIEQEKLSKKILALE